MMQVYNVCPDFTELLEALKVQYGREKVDAIIATKQGQDNMRK